MNELLSICIPTFNRAEVLRACLENLIPFVVPYEIAIYVSDNASTDHTEEIIKLLKNRYPHIYYYRNKKNMEDYNFGLVLKMAKSKYAWLFNDKSRIKKDTLPILMEKLKTKEYDLLILNLDIDNNPRVKEPSSSKVYTDCNQLLIDLGWHMIMVSNSIWSDNLINEAKFEAFMGSPFLQLQALLNCLGQRSFKAYWEALPLFCNAPVPSGWVEEKTFSFFVEKWCHAIEDLPYPYQEAAKKQCIKNHGVKSGLFSYSYLVHLKKIGRYNYKIYKQYIDYWERVTNVPKWKLWLIAVLPPRMI